MVDIVSPYQIILVECVVIPRLCSPAKSAFPVKLPLERISNAVVYSKSTLCNEQCFFCVFFSSILWVATAIPHYMGCLMDIRELFAVESTSQLYIFFIQFILRLAIL